MNGYVGMSLQSTDRVLLKGNRIHMNGQVSKGEGRGNNAGLISHHSGPCENSTGVGRTVINIPKDAPWRVESDALVGFCRKPSFGSKNGDLQLKIGLF